MMNAMMKAEQKMKLAENLKKLILSKNMTVTSASRQIGMNKSTLHNYCNGVVPRNLLKIKELADLLDVSLNELVYGTSSKIDSPSEKEGIEGRFEIVVRRLE
jgi:transcriptional regulator with XRE-family HTH domain